MAGPPGFRSATPGREEKPIGLHVALSAGLGFAYDLAGIRLEVRGEHFGLRLGTGSTGSPPPGAGNRNTTALIPDAELGVGWEFST